MNMRRGETIFTIGHSTRTLAEFVALLRQVDVTWLVDVRSFPRSRTTPQFNLDTLPDSLAAERIGYRHLQVLGGRRHHRKGAPPSLNTYWRIAAFRNYADYAETAEFRAGLAELMQLGKQHTVAIMCSEAVWWRCHRRIVADHLMAHHVTVVHLMSQRAETLATPTPFAVIRRGRVHYPA
jgi:uncharacterized protein (DUF488 family)